MCPPIRQPRSYHQNCRETDPPCGLLQRGATPGGKGCRAFFGRGRNAVGQHHRCRLSSGFVRRARAQAGFSGPELGDVVAGRQLDAQLAVVRLIVVVLRDSLANFCRGHPHDRVRSGVVAGVAVKYLDAEQPLLQQEASPGEGFFDNKPQQRGVAPALVEQTRLEQTLQLLAHLGLLGRREHRCGAGRVEGQRHSRCKSSPTAGSA